MSERIPTKEEGGRLEIPTAQCINFLIRIIDEMALAKAFKEKRVNQEVMNCVRDRHALQSQGGYHVPRHSDAANQGATDFFNHLERYFGESETFEEGDLPVLDITGLVTTLLGTPIRSSVTLEFQGEGIVLYFTSLSQLSITPYTVELKGLEATRWTSRGRLVLLDESERRQTPWKLKLSSGGTTDVEVDSRHGFWPELIDELKRSVHQHDAQAQAMAQEESRAVRAVQLVDTKIRIAVEETMSRRTAATPSKPHVQAPRRQKKNPQVRHMGRWVLTAAFLASPVATFHGFFGLNEKGIAEFASVLMDVVKDHDPSNPFPFLESRLSTAPSNPNNIPGAQTSERVRAVLQWTTPCEIGNGLHKTSTNPSPVYIFDAGGALMQYPPCKK